jgi:hypothetical protein
MSAQEMMNPAAEHTRAVTKRDREERKQRLQTHGRSLVTRSIASRDYSPLEEKR